MVRLRPAASVLDRPN